ncbi:MAG: hypothetical protein K6G56_08845 [Clostridiales bacterium]|nr:hypothetical protein [Clostridiales bacterium]
MKKSVKALIIIAVILLFAVTLSSVAMGVLAFRNTQKIQKTIDESLNKEEDEVLREDDVCIADTYWIRSTKPISDAYISGDTSALDDRQKETLKMASDILASITTDEMTPFEKEKAVYEWLTTKLKSDTSILTVIPETDEEADNPYGVLKYRNAVCVGYATTFRLFMHMMGIECMVVHDSSLGHSWDLVKLDGEWYHTDCYFDSDTGSYYGFNVTDQILAQDHSWNRAFFPHATGTKYNYAVMHAVELDDIYAIPQYVKDQIDAGEKCFSCRFKSGIKAEDEPAAKQMVEFVSEAVGSTSDGYLQYYWSLDDQGNYVLSMFHSVNNGEPDIELPDDVYERLRNAVEDAFGDFEYYDEPYYNDYTYGRIYG